MEKTDPKLSHRLNSTTIWSMIKFFLPLAATGMLIPVTHTVYNAGLARLSKPDLYISAFAVAKSLYAIAQAPQMIIRQSLSGLTHSKKTYKSAIRFFFMVVCGVFIIHFILGYSGLGKLIFKHIMGLTSDVIHYAIITYKIIMWLAFAWFIRDSISAAAIRLRKTQYFTVGTLLRSSVAVILVLLLNKYSLKKDYLVPGLLFLITGYTEAITIFITVKIKLGKFVDKLDLLPSAKTKRNKDIKYKDVFMFAYPILIMSIMRSLRSPIINSGLARTYSPVVAIAAFSVGWGIIRTAGGICNMLHQAVFNFTNYDLSNKKRTLLFSLSTGVLFSIILLIIGATPIGYYIVHNIIGTDQETSRFASQVILVGAITPVMISIRKYFMGIAMLKSKTKWMSKSKVGQAIILLIAVPLFSIFIKMENPAIPAMLGAHLSVAGELFIYYKLYKRYIKSIPNQ